MYVLVCRIFPGTDSDRRTRTMDGHRMFEPAQALAMAKRNQDLPAALRLLHPDIVLETPAFGTTARGATANERALTRFFTTSPDYHVDLTGHADDGETLICWGAARMTLTGNRFGVVPNGVRAAGFCFDPADLCTRSGMSTDAVRNRLFARTDAAGGRR
jgi:hypothetical protein